MVDLGPVILAVVAAIGTVLLLWIVSSQAALRKQAEYMATTAEQQRIVQEHLDISDAQLRLHQEHIEESSRQQARAAGHLDRESALLDRVERLLQRLEDRFGDGTP